jgi:hypothetical protein
MQKHWPGMGPHKPKRAWRVEWLDWPEIVTFIASHEPRSAVRYHFYLSVHESYSSITIPRIRVTRAPQYDALAARQDPFCTRYSYELLGYYETDSRETSGCCEGLFGPERALVMAPV